MLRWCLLLLALCLAASSGVRAQPADEQLSPLGEVPASAQVVRVGFLPNTVYDLDISNSTFYIDTYIWFRWSGPIDPTDGFELNNLVDKWALTKVKQAEQPEILPDGSKYQVVRIEGRIFESFRLDDFPLDQQRLSLLLEDPKYPASALVFLPDRENTSYSDLLEIPGWEIQGWESEPLLHLYRSSLGKELDAGTPHSALRFQLVIERPLNYFLWKLLLPLLIVLTANWVVLLLYPRLIEVRTALPASALVTLVFLQQGYSSALPDVGYLVLLDKLYACAYLLIAVTLAQVVILAVRHGRAGGEETVRRLMRIDRVSLTLQVLLFLTVTLVTVLLR